VGTDVEMGTLVEALRRHEAGDATAGEVADRLLMRLRHRAELDGPPKARERRRERALQRWRRRFWAQREAEAAVVVVRPVERVGPEPAPEPVPASNVIPLFPRAGGGTGSKPSNSREWTSQRTRASRSATAGLEDWNP
jgi:hypothetical protein